MTDDFPAFALSEEHEALREAVRALADDKIAPRAADIYRTSEFPWTCTRRWSRRICRPYTFPRPMAGLAPTRSRSPGRLSRQGPPVLRWAVYEAGKTHARSSAPDRRYYAAVKDRQDGKRAALSEAGKILRQACHILTELGDEALSAA